MAAGPSGQRAVDSQPGAIPEIGVVRQRKCGTAGSCADEGSNRRLDVQGRRGQLCQERTGCRDVTSAGIPRPQTLALDRFLMAAAVGGDIPTYFQLAEDVGGSGIPSYARPDRTGAGAGRAHSDPRPE